MKKLSKFLIMIICLLTISLMVGCVQEPPIEEPGDPIVVALKTPENIRVVVDKETQTTFIYFDAVENANVYTAYVYVEGKATPIMISSLFSGDVIMYDLSNFEGELKISVLACGWTDSVRNYIYLNSVVSELIEYNTAKPGTYTKDGADLVDPEPEPDPDPKHEHTVCPTCGKCTAEDCDGTDVEKCQGHEVDPDPKPNDTSILSGYYANAKSLEGAVLEKALRNIISNTKHTTTYDELKNYLCYADADPENSGNMILFYTRLSIPATYNSNLWNREHVWPKSRGNYFGNSLAGADIHHIRPTIISVNSTRGNLKLGDISGSKTEVKYNGQGTGCYIGGGYFEPSDEIKGDVARIIFYVSLRYGYSITSSGVAELDDLLLWNSMDPVSIEEKNRNEYAYSIQGNRNPFIDHSFLADYIW